MFSEIFVNYIQSIGISAYKIAKETGISQGQMNEYKNGKRIPTADNLVKIADYLDCSIDFLLGRTKEIPEYEEPSEEQRLLSAFRKLTTEGQKAVLMFAEVSAENPKYQKYTDIPKEA